MRGVGCVGLVLALVLAALGGGPASAQDPPVIAEPGDALSIVKDRDDPSNAELAARLSAETPFDIPVARVLIARDDEFADALASGGIQTRSPLLLVPSLGPLPDGVTRELDRLAPSEAIVLGGPDAVDGAVVEELLARGLSVQRRSGPSRIETAIAIAELELPDARTALLARAFSGNPDDPTQGFADALAAGGLAAREQRPILLTESGGLSAPTRAYLSGSAIELVQVVGGTAAISEAVVDELTGLGLRVERIAGASRADTAVEVAKAGGDDSAADTARVVLVDGEGEDAWAGGFAAASHAAFHDAPIVLASGEDLPPQTRAFLDGGAAGIEEGEVVLTCVTRPFTCEQSRRALGLPAVPFLFLDPDSGALVDAGEVVTVTIDPVEAGADTVLDLQDTGRFDGGCFQEEEPIAFDGGTAQLTLRDPFPAGSCETFVFALRDDEPVAVTLAGYLPREFLPEDFGALFSQAGVVGEIVAETTVATDVALSCTSPDGAVSEGRFRVLSAVGSNGRQYLSTASGIPITTFDACTADATLPEGGRMPIWGVFSFIDTLYQDALFEGVGTHATFDLADLDRDVNGFQALFLQQLDTPRPVAAPLPPAPTVPVYQFFEGVRTECDDGTVVEPDAGLPNYAVADGATCTSSATESGGRVLVAQANTEPREAPFGDAVIWTADATVGVTMVQYLAPTG